jgi:hypothetical protein
MEGFATAVSAEPNQPQAVQEMDQMGSFKSLCPGVARDLLIRGRIDVREAFINETFVPEKMEVLLSARQSVAKAPRSWTSQTLLVSLTPLTLRVLRPMR